MKPIDKWTGYDDPFIAWRINCYCEWVGGGVCTLTAMSTSTSFIFMQSFRECAAQRPVAGSGCAGEWQESAVSYGSRWISSYLTAMSHPTLSCIY